MILWLAVDYLNCYLSGFVLTNVNRPLGLLCPIEYLSNSTGHSQFAFVRHLSFLSSSKLLKTLSSLVVVFNVIPSLDWTIVCRFPSHIFNYNVQQLTGFEICQANQWHFTQSRSTICISNVALQSRYSSPVIMTGLYENIH